VLYLHELSNRMKLHDMPGSCWMQGKVRNTRHVWILAQWHANLNIVINLPVSSSTGNFTNCAASSLSRSTLMYVHCQCSVCIVHAFQASEFSHTRKCTNTSIIYIYYLEDNRKEKVNRCHYSCAWALAFL
jgi:hypothetical protein